MGNIGVTELLLAGAIVFFLFGSKKMPEFGKNLGEGLRAFKKELNAESTKSAEKPE